MQFVRKKLFFTVITVTCLSIAFLVISPAYAASLSVIPNAHAVSLVSNTTISQVTHPTHQTTVHPYADNVPCWWFHAVEIYNNVSELCFESSGRLGVNIYNVTLIKDTGNDNHAETFFCNHGFLVSLPSPGTFWSGSCGDVTDILL